MRINLSIKVSQTVHNFLFNVNKGPISRITFILLSDVSNSSGNGHAMIDEIIGFLELNLPDPQ